MELTRDHCPACSEPTLLKLGWNDPPAPDFGPPPRHLRLALSRRETCSHCKAEVAEERGKETRKWVVVGQASTKSNTRRGNPLTPEIMEVIGESIIRVFGQESKPKKEEKGG